MASPTKVKNLDTLVEDAKDFGRHLNSVPVGDVPVGPPDNTNDDISAISFQSTRSIKDKIRIVQNVEDNKSEKNGENLAAKLQGLVKEHIMLDKFQKACQDLQVSTQKNWEGVQQNTYKTFENLNTSTREVVEEKIKPGFKSFGDNTTQFVEHSVGFAKDIPRNTTQFVDEKIKPGWEETVGFTKNIPSHSVTAATQLRETSLEHYETHISPRFQFLREFHDTYSEFYSGNAPAAFTKVDMSQFKYKLAQASLLSIGNILNCDNPVTGLLVWFSILLASPLVAFGGLCSLLVAMTISLLVMSSTHDLRWNTRAGANAFLAGAMLTALVDYPSNLFVDSFWRMVTASSLGIYCLGVHFWFFSPTSTTSVPPLLWTYNLVVGVAILDFVLSDRATLTALAPDTSTLTEEVSYSIFSSTLSSVSAIFGVTQPWCGLLILVGVCFCSRILALWLLVSSCTASLLGLGFGMEAVDLNAGMAGYQAALVAVTCSYYFVPSKPLVLLTVFAIVGTCTIDAAIATVFDKLM